MSKIPLFPNLSAILASLLGVGKYFKEFTSYSSDFNTHISCNAGSFGQTFLVLFSSNTNDGDATVSAIYMLRCGYNGNHLEVSEIVKSGASYTPTFTVDSEGYINTNRNGKYLFLSNKSF